MTTGDEHAIDNDDDHDKDVQFLKQKGKKEVERAHACRTRYVCDGNAALPK